MKCRLGPLGFVLCFRPHWHGKSHSIASERKDEKIANTETIWKLISIQIFTRLHTDAPSPQNVISTLEFQMPPPNHSCRRCVCLFRLDASAQLVKHISRVRMRLTMPLVLWSVELQCEHVVCAFRSHPRSSFTRNLILLEWHTFLATFFWRFNCAPAFLLAFGSFISGNTKLLIEFSGSGCSKLVAFLLHNCRTAN